MFWMIIIGLIVILIGVFLLINTHKKIDNWVEVEGEVISHKVSTLEHFDAPTQNVFAENIKFFVDGEEEIATSPVSSSYPHSIGTKVLILYNPYDPSDIIIKIFSRLYLVPSILIPMGIFLLWGAFNMYR